MNNIIREVFVKRMALPEPISYTRSTNAQPIQFRFSDFIIPKNARAKVYVQKPSGKAVYNDAVISTSENTVTVNIKTQMVSELGTCNLQLRIEQGEDVLVTFSQPIKVYPNYTEGDAEQSRNELGFFDEYANEMNGILGEANKAVQNAKEKAEEASASAKAAKVSETNADKSAKAAENSADDSKEYSKLAESWAHGNTGVRDGENTDNSKYHSEQSEKSATLSESWAVGGTNTRPGENRNNSKFHSDQSKKYSEISKEYLDKVENAGDEAVDKIKNALDMDAPNFMVDLATGNLLYDGGRFAFLVNNGNLEWGLAV